MSKSETDLCTVWFCPPDWEYYKKTLNFVKCIECEINKAKDYTSNLLVKQVFFKIVFLSISLIDLNIIVFFRALIGFQGILNFSFKNSEKIIICIKLEVDNLAWESYVVWSPWLVEVKTFSRSKDLIFMAYSKNYVCYSTITGKIFIELTSSPLNRPQQNLGQSCTNSW